MEDRILLDVLNDSVSLEGDTPIAMFSGLVSSFMASDTIKQVTMSRDLWSLKENPTLSASNMIIGNSEDIVDELGQLRCRSFIVDITSRRNGRDCERMRSIAPSVKSNVSLFLSTSPDIPVNIVFSTTHLNSIVAAMKGDLVVGCNLSEKTSISSSSKAVAVTYRIVEPYRNACNDISPESQFALSACGQLHKDLSSTELMLPPLVIGCSPLGAMHREVLNLLRDSGADLSKVLLNHIALSSSMVEYWDTILSTFPCSLCVDCFGYAATFSPAEGPMFPNDVEMLSAVVELWRRGHASRIILSLSIYCKLQLSAYGGYGYQYLERVIRPRLVSMGVDKETVQQLCCDNLMKLLLWRQRVVEKPKEIETLPCHTCKKAFPAASDYFSKFQFVYCSSKCLAEHRKSNFK